MLAMENELYFVIALFIIEPTEHTVVFNPTVICKTAIKVAQDVTKIHIRI